MDYYMGYGMGRGLGYGYFDPTYLLVLIGAVLCLLASGLVNSTFRKYAVYRSASGLNGEQTARRVLALAGINDVRVQHVPGSLTDHYDPRTKTVNLSDSVYGSNSIAAVSVAAHECGHAIQHAHAYFPLTFRSTLVPAANIGSTMAWPLIILGLLFNSSTGSFLMQIGIWAFSLSVLFQLVTLPVEFNASHRALVMLADNQLVPRDELTYSRKVLGAAALTYVASAAASILQLLRLVLLFGGRRND